MQALYQLSYSPSRCSTGFPRRRRQHYRSPRRSTKSFAVTAGATTSGPRPGRLRTAPGPCSGGGERVEALQRAVLVEKPAVDRLPLQLPVRLDRVAFYDQRPRAFLAPVLV